ncbi:MAG: hypothetical protein AB8B61_04925 [Cyclobacteriaceae bacterium]
MTEKEILESISRSGYLFESEIVKFLSENRYFVESNVIFQDPLTNKNREIDIVAESYNGSLTDKLSCITRYFFELKNNSYPLVLLTRFQFTPNTSEELIKEILTIPSNIDYNFYSPWKEKVYNTEEKIYTQYCSFSKKKNNEFMASHPDELYSSLSKLCWYCEDSKTKTNELFEKMTNQYFRHWLYVPVLLINDDLYELDINNGQQKLEKVKYSQLMVNFHYENTPTSSLIYVVTKNYLNDWLNEMNNLELKVRSSMREYEIKWE